MHPDPGHLSDDELALAANDELSPERLSEVREHVAACVSCRSRLAELESALRALVDARREALNPRLPPLEGARARLQAELESSAEQEPRWLTWRSFGRRWALASVAVVVAAGLAMLWRSPFESPGATDARIAPDPRLTPGMAASVSRAELCASDGPEAAGPVARFVALEVFRSHGVSDPEPRAYELDLLIPPELGGSTDSRNLWPQPYHAEVWNAYAKDALEDRLRSLVCEGEIDLATAQRDIARNWVAAYKKYFRTDRPLVEHASFRKDEPWE